MLASVDALAATNREAGATLAGLRFSGQRRFFQAAAAGYLVGGIHAAETLLSAIRSRKGQGASPLKRYLHESYLDLLFLASDPDGDLLAAKTLLSELRDSQRLLKEYREVLASHPSAGLPPVPAYAEMFDLGPTDVVNGLNEQNREYGGSPDLFTKAWASWQDNNHWHWSGLSRKRMIETLVERGRLGGQAAFMALSLTKIYNSDAHPAPLWSALTPLSSSGVIVEPQELPEQALEQLAVAGQQFLSGIAHEVHDCFTT